VKVNYALIALVLRGAQEIFGPLTCVCHLAEYGFKCAETSLGR
jgi:hypothetical protein